MSVYVLPYTIEGLATPFDKLSSARRTDFHEKISRHAFDEALRPGKEFFACVQHNCSAIIASRSDGTLKAWVEPDGLYIKIQPYDTVHGRRTVELIMGGQLSHFSWGAKSGDVFSEIKSCWPEDGGFYKYREIIRVQKLFEFSVCDGQAVYTQTYLKLYKLI